MNHYYFYYYSFHARNIVVTNTIIYTRVIHFLLISEWCIAALLISVEFVDNLKQQLFVRIKMSWL